MTWNPCLECDLTLKRIYRESSGRYELYKARYEVLLQEPHYLRVAGKLKYYKEILARTRKDAFLSRVELIRRNKL